MATVYAATHRNGKQVAVKMLHPEISADPAIRARFLRNSGGTVPVSELMEEFGALEGERIPEWIERWGQDVALPATRAEAPSVWH